MNLYIKYMVSLRCKMKVKEELTNLGIKFTVVDLGIVEIPGEIKDEQLSQLSQTLKKSGFEILDSKKAIVVEKIKSIIIDVIHYADHQPLLNYSNYISEKSGYDYTYLSNLFSEVKGITIQHYIILNKVEKIKELILYDELNLTEIAEKLHYSSVAHMSNQFKKITGLTPSFFKQLKRKTRMNLENL